MELNENFVDDKRARKLQLEDLAHVKVQEKIDLGLPWGSVESQERIVRFILALINEEENLSNSFSNSLV